MYKLYNVCLEDGYIPTDWKTAHVIPIHKKGDPQLPSNYRPISLTSMFCKVLEKIAREQMLSYLVSNKILPENQHGFIGKKSTTTNLIECFNTWTDIYDKGIQTDVIYLGYSKCFDLVVHIKLMFKLSIK